MQASEWQSADLERNRLSGITLSETKKILVIGVGSIGERHTRCFLASGGAEVTICETDEPRRKAVAERYAVRSFVALDEALDDGPHAAVVCTPAHLHVPLARQIIQAGVDCLIEKPLSVSIDGVDQLIDEASRLRRTVGVAYVTRSHPAMVDMRQAVASGLFLRAFALGVAGDPLEARCARQGVEHRRMIRRQAQASAVDGDDVAVGVAVGALELAPADFAVGIGPSAALLQGKVQGRADGRALEALDRQAFGAQVDEVGLDLGAAEADPPAGPGKPVARARTG